MEKIIKEKIDKLCKILGKPEIILVIYNPFRAEGMQEMDAKYLKYLFEDSHFTSPLFVLSGHGGDWKTGVMFPYIIKSYVKTYKVLVPTICSSSLCYSILKADKLWITPDTKLTQIDPIFEYNGEWLRAIKAMKSFDKDLSQKARRIFDSAQEHVVKLSDPDSIFKLKYMIPGEFQHRDLIIANFMNKDDHFKELSKRDFIEMEMNIEELSTREEINLSKEIVEICQDYTIEKNVRVVFVSSKGISAGDEIGYSLAPLN